MAFETSGTARHERTDIDGRPNLLHPSAPRDGSWQRLTSHNDDGTVDVMLARWDRHDWKTETHSTICAPWRCTFEPVDFATACASAREFGRAEAEIYGDREIGSPRRRYAY